MTVPKLDSCVECAVWASCRITGACDNARPAGCDGWDDVGFPNPGVEFPEESEETKKKNKKKNK